MRSFTAALTQWACILLTAIVVSVSALVSQSLPGPPGCAIAPKVFIISMFTEEGEAWFNLSEFNILARNITVPGLSMLFPQVHCTADGSICQLTTGEGEINAAASISALTLSPLFDLTCTYFLIAGVAGISPKIATIGSVTFARYTVQVGLQFEIDAREIPSNFSTGYIPQGASAPDQYPPELYGTEVYELNENLQRLAVSLAKTATLFDDGGSQAYRIHYAHTAEFAAGAAPPSVVACDTATSDQFWTGDLLAAAFENTVKLFTNGTAVYCTSQQEDNATLESLLRAAILGRVDFSRIIHMRTASDFDRPFKNQSPLDNLLFGLTGFDASIMNLQRAGVKVVLGIIDNWTSTYAKGVKADNYIGDIFGSLGGKPDFGPGNIFGGKKAPVRRSLARRFADKRAVAS